MSRVDKLQNFISEIEAELPKTLEIYDLYSIARAYEREGKQVEVADGQFYTAADFLIRSSHFYTAMYNDLVMNSPLNTLDCETAAERIDDDVKPLIGTRKSIDLLEEAMDKVHSFMED